MIPVELQNLKDPFESHVESFRLSTFFGPKVMVHIARQHCIDPYPEHRTMLCGWQAPTGFMQASVGGNRERWCRTCVRIRSLNGGEIR